MPRDLLGEGPLPGKEPAKAKPATNPAIKRIIDYFHTAHIKRHGIKPIIHGGKDATNIRRLLDTLDESEVELLVDVFFSTADPRVLRSDYHIGSFVSLVPHLRLLLAGSRRQVDDRIAATVDAARRATEPRSRETR